MRQPCATNMWKLVSTQEVAKLLGVHPMTVYRMAKRGQLPAVKLGGRWRFRSDLMTHWVEREMARQMEIRREWHPKSWAKASWLPR